MRMHIQVASLFFFAAPSLFSADVQFFVSAGNLVNSRTEISSAALKDGRVLISGGRRVDGGMQWTESDAEILNPSTGVSRMARNGMIEGRTGHTMTTLQDGKVLVTGGWSVLVGGPKPAMPLMHNSAELFDPATETWESVGSLSKLGGPGNAAVLLKNGKVLVVGESDAELYDPATREFTHIGQTSHARTNTRLTLLPNGDVLVTGASYADGAAKNQPAERFSISKQCFVETGTPVVLRTGRFTATALKDGRVLLVGGDAETAKAGKVELYDPARGSFRFVCTLNTDREGHTATLMADGRVAIMGGNGITNRVPEGAMSFVAPMFGALSSVEYIYPSWGLCTVSAYLKEARAAHGAILTKKGNLVVFGGEAEGESLKSIDALIVK